MIEGIVINRRPLPTSVIIIGEDKAQWQIHVDKKFNWFQKKMLKWCFGFDVKENI